MDEGGESVGYDDYYPFGGIMAGRSTNVGYRHALYKFTGKERDREAGVGLDYFGARYYDPEIGRWLGVDPLAEKFPGWSPYNYALDNPLLYWDPNGMYVRVATEEEKQLFTEALNVFYRDIPIEWERRDSYFYAKVGEGDFNWQADEYLSWLQDLLEMEDYTLEIKFTENFPKEWPLNPEGDPQRKGGGTTEPWSFNLFSPSTWFRESGADLYISPSGYKGYEEPYPIVLMHEMLGHGYYKSTEAIKVTQYYRRLYEQRTGRSLPIRPLRPHGGYLKEYLETLRVVYSLLGVKF